MSSSSLLLDPSENIFILPSELDIALLSLNPFPVHDSRGGSTDMALMDCLRCGIIIARCVIIGDESGDDCSASVEWWRFVQALEKSIPLECLGRTFPGDA
jgi:hypothetical protein